MKALIQFRMTPLMPYAWSFTINLLCGTVSKAFWKPRYTTSVTFPLDISSTHLSKNVSSCRMVDRPPRKPNCLVDNRLFLFKCVRIVSLTAASIILQLIQVRETGREFAATFLRPFLKIGDTFAIFHSSWTSPRNKLGLDSFVIGAASSTASSFSILGCSS